MSAMVVSDELSCCRVLVPEAAKGGARRGMPCALLASFEPSSSSRSSLPSCGAAVPCLLPPPLTHVVPSTLVVHTTPGRTGGWAFTLGTILSHVNSACAFIPLPSSTASRPHAFQTIGALPSSSSSRSTENDPSLYVNPPNTWRHPSCTEERCPTLPLGGIFESDEEEGGGSDCVMTPSQGASRGASSSRRVRSTQGLVPE
mmetsp:Transcript_26955/g.64713  ORF Transcript_26955/g.64713 Transcript_26955/m.64713 type:complete len:201 (-) Transcript_26955:87-689(-)